MDEEDGGALTDLIPDPTDFYEDAEQRLWNEQLRAELDTALDTLPEDQSDAIRRRYFHNQTLKQIAQDEGMSPERIRQKEYQGLRNLRNPKTAKRLRQFVEERTPYYLSVGVARFQNSHTSATEEIVLLRERLLRGVS